MLKIASFFAILAVSNAGVLPAPGVAAYAAQPAGFAYAGQPGLAYAAQPALAYAAQPAHVKVAQPVAYAAQPVAYAAQPVLKAHPVVAKAVVADEPYDPNPQYNYGYSIQDGLTGDSKGHQESRNGDVVQGQYSLVEPDGSTRTVTYTSDPVNGFNAVVDRTAPHVAVAKVHAAPVAYAAAPVAKVHAAPVAYAAGPAFAKVHAAPAYF